MDIRDAVDARELRVCIDDLCETTAEDRVDRDIRAGIAILKCVSEYVLVVFFQVKVGTRFAFVPQIRVC